MRKIELLSPAGDMERLKMSVLYGADAVYLAGTDFGMRSFAGNFSPEELPKAVEFAHSHGTAVHVTVNTMLVLLVSLELDEVMNLSNRILVMYEGEIVADVKPEEITVQELGLYMAGSKRRGA